MQEGGELRSRLEGLERRFEAEAKAQEEERKLAAVREAEQRKSEEVRRLLEMVLSTPSLPHPRQLSSVVPWQTWPSVMIAR